MQAVKNILERIFNGGLWRVRVGSRPEEAARAAFEHLRISMRPRAKPKMTHVTNPPMREDRYRRSVCAACQSL